MDKKPWFSKTAFNTSVKWYFNSSSLKQNKGFAAYHGSAAYPAPKEEITIVKSLLSLKTQ